MKNDSKKVGMMEAKRENISSDRHYNEVYLCGRLTGEGVEIVLPSGDIACEFRIVVEREKSRTQKREVDSIDVIVWSSNLRKKALSLKIDELVSIEGSIRRRFWHGAHGVASRWQIEATSIKKA